MTYVWLAIGVVVLAVSYYWWPGDKRTLRNVAATAATFAGFFLIVNFIVDVWPVKHIEIKEIQKKYVDPPKIVFKDRVVYRDPAQFLKPVNAVDVCKGSTPLKIVSLLVNGNDKDGDTRTYVKVEPVGTGVIVICEVPGDVTGFWSEGDIVQTTRGKPY